MKNIVPATLMVILMVFVMVTVAKAGPLQKKPTWIDESEHLNKNHRIIYYEKIPPVKYRNKKSYFSVRRERRTPVIRPIVRLYGKIRHQ